MCTRREVVDAMLDLAGNTRERPLHRVRLLEPSFGGGDFRLVQLERDLEGLGRRVLERIA